MVGAVTPLPPVQIVPAQVTPVQPSVVQAPGSVPNPFAGMQALFEPSCTTIPGQEAAEEQPPQASPRRSTRPAHHSDSASAKRTK